MLKDPVDCNPKSADTPFSYDKNSIDERPPRAELPDAKNLPRKRKSEFDADCAKVQSDKVFRTPFFKKLSDRVNGKPLTDLVFIEIFSGTGGLCAEVRKWGLANSVGVDAHISKQTKSPVIRIDLTDGHGVSLLWRMLSQPNVASVHLGPPCGTSSRARDIRPGPQPLRSSKFPEGLPHLRGVSLRRVQAANLLYRLSSEVFCYCKEHGILCSVENPERSYMWETKYFASLSKHHLRHQAILHHCMFGSTRKKSTRLLATYPQVNKLAVKCNGQHEHAKWGRVRNKWATAEEVEYPTGLCQAWSNVMVQVLCEHGAVKSASQLSDIGEFTTRQSRAEVGKQPRGNRIPPFVREYKQLIKIAGPLSALPTSKKLESSWQLPDSVSSEPNIVSLPVNSKVLSTHIRGDTGESAEMCVGVHWEPMEFIDQAHGMGHPKFFLKSIPSELQDAIEFSCNMSAASAGKFRTEVMRMWTIKAIELKEKEQGLHDSMPEHIRDVLKSKRLEVFRAMLAHCKYGDEHICDDITKGFDLMGQLPDSGVFQKRSTYPTLTKDQVRQVSKQTRQAIWHSSRAMVDREIAEGVYQATLDETQKGWLVGPLGLNDLPDGASLTRRFGILQTSSSSDGSQTKKVRPIDDFTESLINMTNGCNEKISIHGVDTIASGVVHRLKLCGAKGKTPSLVAKAVDLRKAYKQLAVSSDALVDSYLCVLNPEKNQPEAFGCRVLPFGARAAVQAFCRAAHSIWYLGVKLLRLHWSVYFDDFFVIEDEKQSKHTGLIVMALFNLLGWGVSEEKDAGFLSVARVLGVCIDLSEANIMILKLYNTESRKAEIKSSIDEILKRGSLKKGELLSLRGRLVFAENQVFGKTCNVAMRVLSKYADGHSTGPVQDDLCDALSMLRDRIVSAEPYKIFGKSRSVAHVYADACFEPGPKAGLGGVLVDSNGKCISCFGIWLPEDVVNMLNPLEHETVIAELEALATLLSLHLFESYLVDKDVVVFTDNNAVLSALISGRSTNEVVRLVVNKTFMWEDRLGLLLWHERVPSASNVADGPSRGLFEGDLGEVLPETFVKETLSGILDLCMKEYSGSKDHAPK